ncbi:hypothetical protein BCR39DRAFT_526549 [Naematelia encephala]|uniref:Protein kinase domain-containing protein n=1 Tax=Naematelia encephala TaxID=71784 RepID=A0A1Y2BAB3_9TREE|nr:hypothetical protein BCR39DRAFT_526549 [Naematelia encephala]
MPSRPSTPRREKEELGPPGAGTLFVYGRLESQSGQTLNPYSLYVRRRSRDATPTATPNKDEIKWEDLLARIEQPSKPVSPDSLLEFGIADYTFLPISQGGVLGRGKFSTVYKVISIDGQYFALKHTPLHPHHPLISSRLLREPTLLAQLPPHPCLIGVNGWVRTEGHFYLIEQYASKHVPLPELALPLRPSRAAYILDQLVSVLRDCLHGGGRVVHRDLKGDNVLIEPESGDILLLDLGLATHYSASEPKLTTCCGSPAFHSPEIVHALNRPPGEVTYYGPELDIWCIALTLLSLLLDVRFPLGPSHKSRYVMQERVRDRLQELDELYVQSSPWRVLRNARLSDAQKSHEMLEWRRVRRAMSDFLDIDGVRRMASFQRYQVGPRVQERVAQHAQVEAEREFKSVTFIPSEVKFTLPLFLESPSPIIPPPPTTTPATTAGPGPIVLLNPTTEGEKKVMSYLRYLLRSKGILYHQLGISPNILQLVVPISPSSPRSSPDRANGQTEEGWMAMLNPFKKPAPTRSASVPARQRVSEAKMPATGGEMLKVWIKVEFEGLPASSSGSTLGRRRAGSRVSSQVRRPSVTMENVTINVEPLSQVAESTGHGNSNTEGEGVKRSKSLTKRPPMPSRQSSRNASLSRTRPHPLSRQVSMESSSASSSRLASRSRQTSYDSSHTSASSRPAREGPVPRVLISITDQRGYESLRNALDVKHLDSPDTGTSINVGSPMMIIQGGNKVSGGRSGLSPPDEEEIERGRPRSKDEPRLSSSGGRRSREVPTTAGGQVEADIDVNRQGEEKEAKREVSRGRRRGIGLWEGLFGRGGNETEGTTKDEVSERFGRSISVPPRAMMSGWGASGRWAEGRGGYV